MELTDTLCGRDNILGARESNVSVDVIYEQPQKPKKSLSPRLYSISENFSQKVSFRLELLKSNLSAYGKIHYGTRLRMRMILEDQKEERKKDKIT